MKTEQTPEACSRASGFAWVKDSEEGERSGRPEAWIGQAKGWLRNRTTKQDGGRQSRRVVAFMGGKGAGRIVYRKESGCTSCTASNRPTKVIREDRGGSLYAPPLSLFGAPRHRVGSSPV